MLRFSMHFCRQVHKPDLLNFIRNTSTETKLLKKPWDILSAVCVERLPIISPDMNPLEKQFQTYLDQIELRKSLKSLHEIRHEQDIYQAEALKRNDAIDADLDSTLKQTAQDFEDACVEELSKFSFAKRVSDADHDFHSLKRKLNRNLVLLVQQKIGISNYFLLPQIKHQGRESLRQTAERALEQCCGPEIKVKFFGNAPSGFYKYRYPKESCETAVGAKIFIYFARYVSGNVKAKTTPFKWLDRTELNENLPDMYQQSINKMLIDEPHLALSK